MKEFAYIDWLRRRIPPDPRVLIGPGDDCAVLARGDKPLLVTTDMLLEGTHFRLAEAGARRIRAQGDGRQLERHRCHGGQAARCRSQCRPPSRPACRAGPQPVQGPVRQTGPTTEVRVRRFWPKNSIRVWRNLADAFQTAIIGGDTNSWTGGLVISVTLLGEVQPPGPVRRSGAKPGDWLLVTGPLGGSILGKHLDFTPRVAEALQLHQLVPIHAMIDISDGLAGDLNHIITESGCGALLHAAAIPIHPAVAQIANGRSPLASCLERW